jgi:hypothetical protein
VSIRSVTSYVAVCDVPNCPATSPTPGFREAPEGWLLLRSTAHIAPFESSPYPARRKGRLTYSELCAGGFALALCPDHHNVFDGHQPQTTGHRRGRSGDRNITIQCSCSGLFAVALDTVVIGGRGPADSPERHWWAHLPDDLREYALREAS